MLGTLGEADHFQRQEGALASLALAHVLQQQRQFDVLERRQHRHQIVELEDEADVARAPVGEFGFVELADILAGDDQLAGIGAVDAGDQVEQRALARPRRPHQREELALADVETDAAEDGDLLLSAPVGLDDVAQRNQR